ncbi:MAG: hypothetical protein U0736_12640 [Gemmataceae bacterium]
MATRTHPELEALLREYVSGSASVLGLVADWLADRHDPRERAVREAMANPLSYCRGLAEDLARVRRESMGSRCPIPGLVFLAQTLDDVRRYVRHEAAAPIGGEAAPPAEPSGLPTGEFRRRLTELRAAWVEALFGGE